MDHFAGLDVSVKETSVCIVDDTGRIFREVKVASEPEALLAVLKNPAYHFKRIGLEAGPLSQWLFSALAEAGLPVICVETRHMRAVLKAQINKTDRNDARGMAQMMRVGLYRPVHVKTLESEIRMLLTHRQLLLSKAIALENDLRGTLRNFGLKVGMAGKVKFEARIRELVESLPDLAVLVEPMLIVRRVLRRFKRPSELTSSIVPRGTSFHRMSAQTPPRRTWICGSEPECRRWRDRSATPRGQRRGSSSSAGTLSGYPHSSVSMSLTGSCFSSESAPRLFHHGIRERGGTIFRAALPSHERRQVSIGRGGLGRQNIATSSSRTMANRRCSLLFRWGYFLNADLINQMLSAQIR